MAYTPTPYSPVCNGATLNAFAALVERRSVVMTVAFVAPSFHPVAGCNTFGKARRRSCSRGGQAYRRVQVFICLDPGVIPASARRAQEAESGDEEENHSGIRIELRIRTYVCTPPPPHDPIPYQSAGDRSARVQVPGGL